MKGFDLSSCKKVAQDKNSATFKHKDGHEIKIAIAGLGPDMRKKLAALPLHQAEPEAPIEAPAAVPQAAPQPVADAPQTAPASEPQAPDFNDPALDADREPASAAPQTDTTPPPTASSAPPPSPSDLARIPQTPLLPNETPEEHYAKEAAFQQDLANRHIEPKTYQSMFGKQDTLGKIGTIFGLMLSGAGSGLAHQSNALLDMMNREIDRDLDAQKTSKANANTFLSTQQAHDLQQAQMLHMSNQNALAQQQIAASKAEHAGMGQFNEAKNKYGALSLNLPGFKWDDSLEKENALIGTDLDAKNKMLSTIGQHLDDATPNNPAAKQAVYGIIKPAIDTEIKNNIQKRHAMQDANTAARANGLSNNQTVGNPPPNVKDPEAEADPTANYDAVNQSKYLAMKQRGLRNAQLGVQDIIDPKNPQAAIPKGEQDKVDQAVTNLNESRQAQANVNESFNKILTLGKSAGQVPASGVLSSIGTGLGSVVGGVLSKTPMGVGIGGTLGNAIGHAGTSAIQSAFERERSIEVEHVKQRLPNSWSDEAKDKFAEASLPSWKDMGDEKQLAEVHHKMNQSFTSSPAEKNQILTTYGLKYPPPNYGFHMPKEKETSTSSAASSYKGGYK